MARSRAFTLVELLVVIAIILILAAILFPVFGKVREKARQTACMSNQRQIAMAFTMLIQDNKEYFPGVMGDPDPKVWRTDIANNADDKLFNCPSTVRGGTPDDPEIAMNFYLYGVAMGDIKEPQKVVVTADANNGLLEEAADVDLVRHNKGYIASFVDGHVQFYPAASSPVIWGNGDEGTLFSFGALHQTVTYSDGSTATGEDGGVSEGDAVLLVNDGATEITAAVSVAGGATPPAQGLLPASANLKISAGKGKAFALYCATDAGGEKVDTTYTFGDPSGTGKVTITCYKPRPLVEEAQP
jgi:prepilin-type N-terminal cleavage/methylation domain-containing protein/prepilin-type processing-associated H-X9-DG protein